MANWHILCWKDACTVWTNIAVKLVVRYSLLHNSGKIQLIVFMSRLHHVQCTLVSNKFTNSWFLRVLIFDEKMTVTKMVELLPAPSSPCREMIATALNEAYVFHHTIETTNNKNSYSTMLLCWTKVWNQFRIKTQIRSMKQTKLATKIFVAVVVVITIQTFHFPEMF